MNFCLFPAHQNNVIHVSASMVDYNGLNIFHIKIRHFSYAFPMGQFPIPPVGRDFPDPWSEWLFVGRDHRPLASAAQGPP